MDPIIGSSLIGGATSLLNGVSSIFTNKSNQRYDSKARAEEHQRALEKMEEQQRLNREQYDYELKMESPSAQRARLEDAGLNPALMYGSGASGSSISATMSGVSPAPSAPTPGKINEAPRFDALGSTLVQAQLATAQRDLIKAQEEEIRSRIPDPGDNDLTPQQIAYLVLQEDYFAKKYGNDFKQIENAIAEATKDTEIEKRKAELSALYQRVKNDTAVSEATVQHLESLCKKYGVEIEDIEATRPSRIAEKEAAAENYEWQAARNRALNYWDNELKPEMKREISERVDYLDSMADLNDENRKYVKAYVILRALDTGGDVLSKISREGRGWASSFLNRSKGKKERMLDSLFEAAGENASYNDILELLSLFGSFGK